MQGVLSQCNLHHVTRWTTHVAFMYNGLPNLVAEGTMIWNMKLLWWCWSLKIFISHPVHVKVGCSHQKVEYTMYILLLIKYWWLWRGLEERNNWKCIGHFFISTKNDNFDEMTNLFDSFYTFSWLLLYPLQCTNFFSLKLHWIPNILAWTTAYCHLAWILE